MILLLVASLIVGCGGEETPTTGESATTSPSPTASATPSGSPSAESDCSAANLSGELPAQELPTAVAEKRRAIAEAAVACDFERLEQLASDAGFTYSYGASGGAAEYWQSREQAGDEVLGRLLRLLALPFTRNEAGFYAWPSAYTENPTSRDWDLLRGIYDRREIASFRRNGSYLGHRIGISRDGEWQFFVAGD